MLSCWKANIQDKGRSSGGFPHGSGAQKLLATSPDWIWKSPQQALSSSVPHGEAWADPQAQHAWAALNQHSGLEGCCATRSSADDSVVRVMPVCRVIFSINRKTTSSKKRLQLTKHDQEKKSQEICLYQVLGTGDRYAGGNAFFLEVKEDDHWYLPEVVGSGWWWQANDDSQGSWSPRGLWYKQEK